MGHNSYAGCQKCMVQGVYCRTLRKMSFPRVAVTEAERLKEIRTNSNFRSQFQPEHHHTHTILEELPIDMIKCFPTSDALHLFDLGIMKRWGYFYMHFLHTYEKLMIQLIFKDAYDVDW